MPEIAAGALWSETEVTFTRQKLAETMGGGFRADPRDAYLVAFCHVEVEERNDPNSATLGIGLVQSRCWRLFLDVRRPDHTVLDPATYPAKGDRVQFTTDYGAPIDLPIRYVQSPDSILDHFELETEEYQ